MKKTMICISVLILLLATGVYASSIETKIVSVSSSGEQGNGDSWIPSISADGRYVAFPSLASNLIEGDTNNASDVFVHDRQTGKKTRVSVSSSGEQGSSHSWRPSISADGRYVAFLSRASNLIEGDTNNAWDVFVHDRQTGETTRVSVSSSGEQSNGDSWNESISPSISADGRYVAFPSLASNLIEGDTNGTSDVFVHDCQTGETIRVSVSSSGRQGNSHSWIPSISADGRYISFSSLASNLIEGDTNCASDVFVHDRQTGKKTRVSVSSSGEQGNSHSWKLSISANGRYVAFSSLASNLIAGDTNGTSDVFVHDCQTGETIRVSVSSSGEQSNGDSWDPSMSADGRFVAFYSRASNLIAGDTNGTSDVFVHDCQTGETIRVSVSSSGEQSNGDSWESSISADGRYIAFSSWSSNLVDIDNNNWGDVFIHLTPIVFPESHNFGKIPIGHSSIAKTFVISNLGNADLMIGMISITGINDSEFSIPIENDQCSGQTLSPATICTIQVVLSPISAEAKSATLRVSSNDPYEDLREVPLSGSGYVPVVECNLVPDTTIIKRGETLYFQATVSNHTDKSETVLFATDVILPNGNRHPPSGYLIDPLSVFLGPSELKSGHRSHTIPVTAPTGIYIYYGYVGVPGNLYNKCHFEFTVTVP